MAEEAADDVRQLLQPSQRRDHQPLQMLRPLNHLLPDLMRLRMCPVPDDCIAVRSYGLFAARRWLEARGYERIGR